MNATVLVIFILASCPVQLVMTYMYYSSSLCPVGMTHLSGTGSQYWCLRFYNHPKTFCDAVKTCRSNGEEMISKSVFDAVKSSSSIETFSDSWIGLVDALDERGSNKAGWVWMMDGQVTSGTETYFAPYEPNDTDKQDCTNVFESDKSIRDAKCSETHRFYCYTDPTKTIVQKTDISFIKVEILVRVQPDPGCWISLLNIPTSKHCASTCFTTLFSDCVGFYWHEDRRQCVILPYFDAAVPLNNSDMSANVLEMMQWTKYRRTG